MLFRSALLYQGSFVEYPVYVATGEEFEEFNIVSIDMDGNSDLIDHNLIHVYVKSGTSEWKQYSNTNSLYLESAISETYELRLNENQRYTIKFGNGITGKKLNSGDFVSVYFLKSNGPSGEVGPNVLDGTRLFLYNSDLYSEIMGNVRPTGTNILIFNDAVELNFTNNLPS